MKKNHNKFIPHIRQEALKKLISQCPICEAKDSTFNVKIIEEKEDAQLTYIKCNKCQGKLMALIVANGPIVSSIGLITDLNHEDIEKFRNREPLHEDDLIEIHQILNNN
ncbi:MAG: hypothetical protein ABH835_00085 [Patescibacteria group bacterium]